MNPNTSGPSALGLSPNTKSVAFVLTVTAEITDSTPENKLQNKTVFCLGSDSDGKHIQNAVQLATPDHTCTHTSLLLQVSLIYTDNYTF